MFIASSKHGPFMMKRPNTSPPDQLSPTERHAELCALLARGLIRLRMRENAELSGNTGEFRLHNSLEQSGTAETLKRRPA